MKMSWKDFYTLARRVAGQRLHGMEEVTAVWTLDETPAAGYIGLALQQFSGGSPAWLRFRERPAGIFFQINDAPWGLMPRIDSEMIGGIVDRILEESAGEPGRAAKVASNEPLLMAEAGKGF